MMTAEMEKALEDIVKRFLLHETKPETTDEVVVENPPVDNNNSISDQDEFVQNLYQCLAERGILREVHAFLRQRLVEVLKGTHPNLVTVKNHFNWMVVKLFEDFLCCHKLLFTFSVLVTEMDNTDYVFRRDGFGKMMCKDVEKLLDKLNIKEDSEQSRKILTLYSEKEHFSLLECIMETSFWRQQQQSFDVGSSSLDWQFLFPNDNRKPDDNNRIFTSVLDDPKNISDKLRQVDYEFAERLNPAGGIISDDGADGKFLQMQLVMEKDKQLQIKNAIQKFREEELVKIRDEIETRLKFEMISKEKELLRNYEDRVSHMKNLLDREKEIWSAERMRKEKELFTQRQDLVKLMEHVKEKKVKLKEALEKTELGKERLCQPNVDRNIADSSVGSEETSSERDKEINLKYFNLASTIKRLREENLHLQKKMSKQVRNEQLIKNERQRQHDFDSGPEDCSIRSMRSGVNDDKIALLQYTVEKQTEELEKLKKQLKRECVSPATSTSHGRIFQQERPTNSSEHFKDIYTKSSVPQQINHTDQDLQTFLAESKRRFAEIEKKAEIVGSSLRDVFRRNSNVGKLNRSKAAQPTIIPPTVPKLPPSLQKKSASHQTNLQTKSILAPKYMSATSSIDTALKSFLLNQDEDPFNSFKVPISESGHLRFLRTSTAQLPEPTSTLAHNIIPEPKEPKISIAEAVQQTPTSYTFPSTIAAVPSHSRTVTIAQEPLAAIPTSTTIPTAKATENVPEQPSPTPQQIVKEIKQPIPSTTASQATVESRPEKITKVEMSKTDVSKSPPKSVAILTSPPTKAAIEKIHMDSISSNNIDQHHITNKSNLVEVTAAGSGALIQSKVPSPENSQQQAMTTTKLQSSNSRHQSWGDILSAEGGPKTKTSMSSSNSVSFIEGGGDDDDFMAEEDFWVL